jgi:Protein of unknown function (DUF3551)
MRMFVVALLGLLAWSEAKADPYAWCAEYRGGRGGSSNCGFVTLQQCQWTVSGIGGFCVRNLFYTGPGEGASLRRSGKTRR